MCDFESTTTADGCAGESEGAAPSWKRAGVWTKLPQRWTSLVLDPTDRVAVQILRYTAVGGLAFVVDFGTLVLLTSVVGLHYLVSAAIAFLAGLTTNYVLSTTWVFQKRTFSDARLEFLLFAGIGLVGLGFNEVLMWLLTDVVGLHYTFSKLGSTGVVFLWNFLVRRYFLFR
jgi:putative flippase GtrA